MHEATCTNCGRDVQITPDAEFCSACGENLKALIPLDKVSQYFYDRVSHLAETASNRAALAETQRGLEQVASPELQLLGAILAEGEGEYDLMRRYVSRIPVADRLRDEGEWLLRSHQARQSAQRLGTQRIDNPRVDNPRIDNHLRDDRSSTGDRTGDRFAYGQRERIDDELLSMRTRRIGQLPNNDTQIVGPTREIRHADVPVNMLDPNQGSRRLWPTVLMLALLFGMVWGGWRFIRGSVGDTQQASSSPSIDSADNPAATELEPQIITTGSEAPADGSAPEQNNRDNTPPTDTPSDGTVPNDVVNTEDGTQPVAALDDVSIARPYDISSYLLNNGRSDLAAFRLDATLQGNQMAISGAVDTAEQRQAVIELAQTTSDLVQISALDLLVRQPSTYVIEAGDTLWLIADKLYGDGERWQEIYDANQNILSSPDAIIVGQELKVPLDR